MCTDDPGGHRAGVDADPKGQAIALIWFSHVISDPLHQIGDGVRVIGPGSADLGGGRVRGAIERLMVK